MKYVVVNPISFISNPAPTISIPTLLGVLESAGLDVDFVDLNLKYLNLISSKEEISKFINFYSEILKNDQFNSLKIFRDINLQIENLKEILDKVLVCKLIMKSKKYFFNYFLQNYSKKVLNKVFNSFLYVSDSIKQEICKPLDDNFNQKTKFNIDIDTLNNFFENNLLCYKEFYEKEADKILKLNPDVIGVSINHDNQLVPGLYFCYILKKKTKCHINVGGSFYKYYHEEINNLLLLFDNYFNSISDTNCPNTPVLLAKHLEGQISLSDVKGLIYKNSEGNIIKNEVELNNKNTSFFSPSFDKIDFTQYICPEIVLPIETSTSCYWKKCIFCTCNDMPFVQKKVEELVNEIEFLSKRHNTKYFYFWDNCISPAYLEKMADLLIEKGLNINYSIFARFEKEFNLQLLKKAKKSGLNMIYFGLDSASDRILKVINKGITISNAKNVLKLVRKAKIFSGVYLIFGHPTETSKDLLTDYKFIKKNQKYINTVIISPEVIFIQGSLIEKNYDYYSSKILTTKEERMKYYKLVTNMYQHMDIHSVYNLIYIAEKGFDAFCKDVEINKFIHNSKFLYKYYSKYKLKQFLNSFNK